MTSPKKTSNKILDLIYADAPGNMTREEARAYTAYLLTLMTKKQKSDMVKKVEVCTYYIDAVKKKGMDKKRARSIIKRKMNIPRQHIDSFCKPCEEIVHGNNI